MNRMAMGRHTDQDCPPRRDPVVWGAMAAMGALLLLDLGDAPLSADEAQTAVLARTILRRGLPFAGDGINVLGIAHHPEVDARGLWSLHPWLPLYLAAGSMKILGVGVFAARLPFVLCGWGAAWLAVAVAHRVPVADRWRSRAARYTAWLLAGSVPFLLHVRQCRYYGLAMLLALAWLLLDRRRGGAARVGSVLAGLALFHTHYLVFLTFAVGLLGYRGVRGPRRRALVTGGAVAGLALPWWLWVNRPQPPDIDELPGFKAVYHLRYLAGINDWLLPFVLAVPVGVWLWRHRRRHGAWAVVVPLATTVVLAPPLSITPGIRYACVAMVLVPALLGIVLSRWGSWGPGVVAVLVGTNVLSWVIWAPLGPAAALGSERAAHWRTALGPAAHLRVPLHPLLVELTTRDDSPVEMLARYLRRNVAPGERVLLTGNIEPLAFYADVPLARTVAPGRLRATHLHPPHVWEYDPDRPPPPGTYAWYVPGCAEWKGMPADLSDWLGVPLERVELPVRPCPAHPSPDPRLHRYTPTPSTPSLVLYRLGTSVESLGPSQEADL